MHNAIMDHTPPLRTLIISGLGYCCLYSFFSFFTHAQTVAERLGCSRQAVSRQMKRYREGEFCCSRCDRCIIRQLQKAGRV